MRITHVYLKGVGPFAGRSDTQALRTDDERVLLTGISGSGKSTVLFAIAFLWRLLDPAASPKESPEGSMAMHVAGLPGGDALVAWSDDPAFLREAAARHPDARQLSTNPSAPEGLRGALGETAPGMILLDADMHFARQEDGFENAWFLTDDDVKDSWPQALSQLHARDAARAQGAIAAINRLLVDKSLTIGPDAQVRVVLKSKASHGPQQLSMGEKHVAVLCFCVACCLRQGGVLLLDEPAVHLHPSQVIGLLATLEHFCRKAGGQLLLVSHNTAIWDRYRELGLMVALEAARHE